MSPNWSIHEFVTQLCLLTARRVQPQYVSRFLGIWPIGLQYDLASFLLQSMNLSSDGWYLASPCFISCQASTSYWIARRNNSLTWLCIHKGTFFHQVRKNVHFRSVNVLEKVQFIASKGAACHSHSTSKPSHNLLNSGVSWLTYQTFEYTCKISGYSKLSATSFFKYQWERIFLFPAVIGIRYARKLVPYSRGHGLSISTYYNKVNGYRSVMYKVKYYTRYWKLGHNIVHT